MIQKYTLTILLSTIVYLASAQNYNSPTCFIEEEGSVTDIEGNEYKTVKIGTQWWMAQNLRTTKYSDGSEIPNVTIYNEGEEQLVRIHGLYYKWKEAMRQTPSSDLNPSGVQGICPDGWHIPSNAEWKQLELYIGMRVPEVEKSGARGELYEGVKVVDPLYFGLSNGNCTGLSILPSGWVNNNFEGQEFGVKGYYITATEEDSRNFWVREFHNQLSDRSRIGKRPRVKSGLAISCRCVKD